MKNLLQPNENGLKTHDGYPARRNPDGSYSTEVSITVTNPRINGGRPTNIPSLWGGVELPEEAATLFAIDSKRQFEGFNSIDEAVSAARRRSDAGGASAQSAQQKSRPANALQQFIQAASNEAAGAVSGPVDLIGMGLRKLGVPVPRNALMSSDWMRQNGLMQDVPQSGASLAGQTFGLLSPVVAAAKAPQIARGLLTMGENAAAPKNVSRGASAGQRGIFMGDLSKTWDKSAAAKALEMEKAGADPRAIWQETGTFKGVDGKWRQEIDDSASRMSGVLPDDAVFEAYKRGGVEEAKRLAAYVPPYLQEGTREVGDVFSHRGLTDAYPWATQHRTYKLDSANPVIGEGSYSPTSGVVSLSRANEPTARSAMLHELQHAVQENQGFARGGSPKDMPLVLEDLTDKASKEARTLFDIARRNDPLNPGDVVKPGVLSKALGKEKEALKMRQWLERINSFGDGYANDAYKRLAGEAEARAVQKRMNMNPLQRRETFPLDSYDVPINELIVRR